MLELRTELLPLTLKSVTGTGSGQECAVGGRSLKPCLTLFPGNPDFRNRRIQSSKRKRKEDILILRAMTLNYFDH